LGFATGVFALLGLPAFLAHAFGVLAQLLCCGGG